MPIRCVERPNRSHARTYKAKDVGRIYCIAIRNGIPKLEIEQEIKKCAEVGDDERRSQAAEALAVAEQAIEANNLVLGTEIEVLQRMLSMLNIVAALGRYIVRIPLAPARVLGASAIALQELAKARLGTIVAQRAANDAALVVVRRAAANEAQFLRAAGG